MAKKPLEIDMIAGSQLRDTQGEMLSVEGADISDLQSGKGRLNDNHGKGFFNAIGRVTSAKKIFKKEDCDSERQNYYWDKVKAPFIYVKGVLYDDEDHPNAKAAAAILRNIHKADVPLKLKASVEGGVVSRGIADSSLLARTKIHSVALTFTPANNATLVEPTSLSKSMDEAADMELIKAVMHLAESNVPSFRHIARDASATKVHKNLQKIAELVEECGLQSSINVSSKEEIISDAIETKIESNVKKINEFVKTIKEEELDKSWKGAVAGAAMLGTSMSPSTGAPAVNSSLDKPAIKQALSTSHADAYRKIASKNPILGAIAMTESSGGKNYSHKTITDKDSPQYGHTAGGMFGMMPNSAAFILKKNPELAKKYADLAEAAKDINKNHHIFTERFNSDPNAAIDFADALLKRTKSKTKDKYMMIYAWNHGLKGTWQRYKNEGPNAIKSSPYVQSVLSAYKDSKKSMKKALTAGYGGASASGSLAGGGEIQSESLDSGNKGFKYVTCNKCGKEQIHAKHQVKCRECGQSWSLEKLYKLLKSSDSH